MKTSLTTCFLFYLVFPIYSLQAGETVRVTKVDLKQHNVPMLQVEDLAG